MTEKEEELYKEKKNLLNLMPNVNILKKNM